MTDRINWTEVHNAPLAKNTSRIEWDVPLDPMIEIPYSKVSALIAVLSVMQLPSFCPDPEVRKQVPELHKLLCNLHDDAEQKYFA